MFLIRDKENDKFVKDYSDNELELTNSNKEALEFDDASDATSAMSDINFSTINNDTRLDVVEESTKEINEDYTKAKELFDAGKFKEAEAEVNELDINEVLKNLSNDPDKEEFAQFINDCLNGKVQYESVKTESITEENMVHMVAMNFKSITGHSLKDGIKEEDKYDIEGWLMARGFSASDIEDIIYELSNNTDYYYLESKIEEDLELAVEPEESDEETLVLSEPVEVEITSEVPETDAPALINNTPYADILNTIVVNRADLDTLESNCPCKETKDLICNVKWMLDDVKNMVIQQYKSINPDMIVPSYESAKAFVETESVDGLTDPKEILENVKGTLYNLFSKLTGAKEQVPEDIYARFLQFANDIRLKADGDISAKIAQLDGTETPLQEALRLRREAKEKEEKEESENPTASIKEVKENEGKEIEMSLDEFKKKYKDKIDNSYRSTYGDSEKADPDLYNELAEFLMSKGIVGDLEDKKETSKDPSIEETRKEYQDKLDELNKKLEKLRADESLSPIESAKQERALREEIQRLEEAPTKTATKKSQTKAQLKKKLAKSEKEKEKLKKEKEMQDLAQGGQLSRLQQMIKDRRDSFSLRQETGLDQIPKTVQEVAKIIKYDPTELQLEIAKGGKEIVAGIGELLNDKLQDFKNKIREAENSGDTKLRDKLDAQQLDMFETADKLLKMYNLVDKNGPSEKDMKNYPGIYAESLLKEDNAIESEMDPDDFEFSLSEFDKYFNDEVSQFIADNYLEDEIKLFDKYLKSMLDDNSIMLSDLRDYDIDWIKKMFEESKNYSEE